MPASIAYFISSHGFGHAARAAAVMQATAEYHPDVQFEVFTTVPSWFFQDSLSIPFNYHHLLTDFGLVQKEPFQADPGDTLHGLEKFYPISPGRLGEISATIQKLECRIIICDIAPMGLLIAKHIGIPSVLVENFTWDWIYQQYSAAHKNINKYINYLKPIFESADYHVQTMPICSPKSPDLVTGPISRKPKAPRDQIRQRLGLLTGRNMILITTGGIPQSYNFPPRLEELSEFTFVMPGAGPAIDKRNNLIILPHRSDYYHPDLCIASDAVIGKVGYSTLSEVYYAGIPFGYVARANYNESGPMVSFIKQQMPGFAVEESEFFNGEWIDRIEELLMLPRAHREGPNGAEQIGEFILSILSWL
jgi:UDP-N-acetylglucosamine:LPS N-acetylglucosamine transferase